MKSLRMRLTLLDSTDNMTPQCEMLYQRQRERKIAKNTYFVSVSDDTRTRDSITTFEKGRKSDGGGGGREL